jgi:hypothetical protein
MFQLGPGDTSSESVDIWMKLLLGESATVTVQFDSTATQSDCIVWALVYYQYPTKGIGETALRFEGEREVSFTFGWESVRLLPFFVTDFVIRLFYFGPNEVSVSVMVTHVGNIVTYVGFGLLAVSLIVFAIPFLSAKINERRRGRS